MPVYPVRKPWIGRQIPRAPFNVNWGHPEAYDLISCWPLFNTARDIGRAGNHATLLGTSAFEPSTIPIDSLTLRSDTNTGNYAQIKEPATNVSELTILFRVYFIENPGGNDDFFGNWSDKQLFCRDLTLQTFVRNAADSAEMNAVGPSTVATGIWYDVAIVLATTGMTVYQDAVPGTEATTLTGPYIPTKGTFWGIGQGRFAPVDCQICDVRIHSTAFSRARVARYTDGATKWALYAPRRTFVTVPAAAAAGRVPSGLTLLGVGS